MRDVSFFAPGPSVQPLGSDVKDALRRIIAVIIKTQGYDGIQSSAMAYIVNNLESLLLSLSTHAHELAIMANRRTPSTHDVYLSLQHSGQRLRPAALEEYVHASEANRVDWTIASDASSGRPAWCDPFEGCLPSESEDDSTVEEQSKEESGGVIATRSKAKLDDAPQRKRRRRRRFRPTMAEVPSHLPSFPPKHTWLSTPSYPAHSMTMQPPLAFLDLKVSSNRLMESSLRGLIRATDSAVLDSQVQRGAFATNTNADFSINSAINVTADDSQDFAPETSALESPSIETSANLSEQDPNRIRLKKGRTLSLRLQTPLISQSSVSSNTPLGSPAVPPKQKSHRQSMSISGPQSAIVSSFGSHFRHNTVSSGPWSANSNQTPLSWSSTFPARDTTMSPLQTPLTSIPGIAYQYPPTPSYNYTNQILSITPSYNYTNQILSMHGANKTLEQDTSIPVGLPPIVNYKRTWYKKSSNGMNHSSAVQNRIKS